VVETALDAELTDHLGYDKNSPQDNGSGNRRNGKYRKRLKGDHGDIDLEPPRDREITFEPHIVKKGQSRLTQMDDQILTLYAKGMSTLLQSHLSDWLQPCLSTPLNLSRNNLSATYAGTPPTIERTYSA